VGGPYNEGVANLPGCVDSQVFTVLRQKIPWGPVFLFAGCLCAFSLETLLSGHRVGGAATGTAAASNLQSGDSNRETGLPGDFRFQALE
jgi:hypothetical protein